MFRYKARIRRKRILKAGVETKKQRTQREDEDKIFSENERIIMDVVVKSDFAKLYIYNSEYRKLTEYRFVFNNLKLEIDVHINKGRYYTSYRLYAIPANTGGQYHILKKGNFGKAKTDIILNIVAVKREAFVNNTISSAFNNKIENGGDCPFCGTKNSDDKTNCVNCAAVIRRHAA